MTERKDERWLDEQLQRAVNETKPVFDAESWKRRHRDEYEALLARSRQSDRGRVRLFPGRWIVRLAVAATVILAVGVLFMNQQERLTPPTDPIARSSAGMMSMMSLRMAYEQGGFDALDQQLQNTLDEFGPRSSSVPTRGWF